MVSELLTIAVFVKMCLGLSSGCYMLSLIACTYSVLRVWLAPNRINLVRAEALVRACHCVWKTR